MRFFLMLGPEAGIVTHLLKQDCGPDEQEHLKKTLEQERLNRRFSCEGSRRFSAKSQRASCVCYKIPCPKSLSNGCCSNTSTANSHRYQNPSKREGRRRRPVRSILSASAGPLESVSSDSRKTDDRRGNAFPRRAHYAANTALRNEKRPGVRRFIFQREGDEF